MERRWLGVDLGGTKILAGLLDDDYRVIGRAKESTPFREPPAAVVGQIVKAVERVLAETKTPPEAVAAMGISVPGQVRPDNGHVTFAPNLDWRNVDLPGLLPKEWPWPKFVENDVRMGTYGEWKHGAAQGATHVLGIFAGTGVGGGLILDGKLYRGFKFHAGEIGHTIIHWRRGTELEAIAGRRNMMSRAAEILADAPKRVRREWKGVDLNAVKSSLLAEYYQKDDPVAVQLIDDAARAIGAAVGSCVNLLSPEVIVLGGGVTGALGESFPERVWEIAQRYALPGAADGVRFVTAQLGDDAGIVGSAAYARDQLN